MIKNVLVLLLLIPITTVKSTPINTNANEGFESAINQLFFGIDIEKDIALIKRFSKSSSCSLAGKSPEYWTMGLTGKGGLRQTNYEYKIINKKILDFVIDDGRINVSKGKYDKEKSYKLLSFGFMFSFNKKEDALMAYKSLYDKFSAVSENEVSEGETIVSLKSVEFRNNHSKTFQSIDFSLLKLDEDSTGFHIAGGLR